MSKTESCALVVDDDSAACRAIERMLKRSVRCSVRTASTLEEALHVIEHDGPFDFAVVDLLLPREEDGFHLIAMLRARGIAVFAVTGSTDPEHSNRCLRMGALCVRKPPDPQTLACAIRRVRSEAALLENALRIAVDELQIAHDLTPMEGKLAWIIARGIGPSAFSNELGVMEKQLNTTRTHLFKKCRVSCANGLQERLLKRAFAILVEHSARGADLTAGDGVT